MIHHIRRFIRPWGVLSALCVFPLLLLIPYAATGANTWNIRVKIFAVLAMTAGASFMCAAVVGFIFAVPRERERDRSSDATSFLPNNNLERVSEWLTGIIIGVSLVQFRSIADGIRSLARSIAIVGTSGGADDWPFIVSIILFHSTCGFLVGYLFTAFDLRGVAIPDVTAERTGASL